MRSFCADDGEILHVRVQGHGPPVVLLHGWAADHAVWHPLMAELAHRFTVYAPDARGHGEHSSTGPRTGRAPPVVTRMARDLRVLMAHFGLVRPALVGHSMGALVLWQMIADSGCENVGALCTIDQSPRLITDATWRHGIYGDWPVARDHAFLADLGVDFAETVLRLIAFGLNEPARRRYHANGGGIQRLRHALRQRDPQPHITCWQSLSAADYRAVLPTITVPSLLVYGAASNYYGPAVARTVAAAIPGAALHLFEDADHSPHYADRARFLTLLGDFISGSACSREIGRV